MFGHRFFGARYYGPRYFGPGISVSVVVANVLRAVPMGGGVVQSHWKAQTDKRRKEAALEEAELLMLGRAALDQICNDMNS